MTALAASPGSDTPWAAPLAAVPVPHAVLAAFEGYTCAYDNIAFAVSCPRLEDNPIIYCSEAFLRLTGYTSEEVLGRNCRFLQGPNTERATVVAIRDAIRESRQISVVLVNYRRVPGGAGREPFHNLLTICPLRDSSGAVAWHVGIQSEVSEATAREFAEREGCEAPAAPDAAGAWLPDAQPALAAEVGTLRDELERRASQWAAATAGGSAAEPQLRLLAGAPCSSDALPLPLLQKLVQIHNSFCISDPSLPDAPIVHASDAFLKLTGYPAEEVLGRNCRFLQGPGTDRAAVARMRAAIAAGVPVTETLLNYTREGAPFWNRVHVAPVRDAGGRVAMLVGVQMGVAEGGEGGSAAAAEADTAQLGTVGRVRVAARASSLARS